MAIGEQVPVVTQASAQSGEIRGDALLSSPDWKPATRIAFRFCVLYFGLYIVLTQMLTSLLFATTNDAGAFELDTTAPAKAAVVWIAAHVFRITHPIVTTETGSGDRIYDWIVLACILMLAIIGTLVWSLVDTRNRSYPKLHSWFRLFARFSLAATVLTYGAAKAIPLQMPFPFLNRLLEPYGDFSPMGVLWASIGASPAYEIFTGCAEMLGGILLIFPRTTMLGACVPGRRDRSLRPEHDVRHAGEAPVVPHDSAFAISARAGGEAAREHVSSRSGHGAFFGSSTVPHGAGKSDRARGAGSVRRVSHCGESVWFRFGMEGLRPRTAQIGAVWDMERRGIHAGRRAASTAAHGRVPVEAAGV